MQTKHTHTPGQVSCSPEYALEARMTSYCHLLSAGIIVVRFHTQLQIYFSDAFEKWWSTQTEQAWSSSLPAPQAPVLATFSDQNGLALPELCYSLLSLLYALTEWEPVRDSLPRASVPTAPLCNQQYAYSMPAPAHEGMSQDQEPRVCLCACMLLWLTNYSFQVCWCSSPEPRTC